MASAILSSRHSSIFHTNTLSILPYSSACSVSSTFCSRTGRIQPRELRRTSAAAADCLRCLSRGGRGSELTLRAERDRLIGASSSLDWLRFKKGVGFGPRHGWSSSRSDGGRGRIQRISVTKGRQTFSGNEEGEEDAESKNISLPIIGELPLTRRELSMFTPMKLFVWAVLATLAFSVWGIISSMTIFNPRFWAYSTWILVKWPWPAAILVGIATLVTAFRSSKRKPQEWEQVLLLLGSLTWLILVPVGLFNGFVDGWPLFLFTLYVGFFLISAVVRYRMYGDLESKDKNKQWETTPSRLWQIGFVASVVLGHWLAAYETPFLPITWNLEWKTIAAIVTLAVSVITHYFATYFLGKYFDRLIKPQAVVMFGPYRVVRHPIYSSYILLFVGYCLALRSYKSLLFLFTACIVYYEQRTKLEEDLLVENFGELYEMYRERVANKYFPLLY